jgi:NIPSNAP
MSVYEMRIYHAAPGKMDALLARFADHTEALFARHGIKTTGYWVAQDDPRNASQNLLMYMVEHESVEAAEKNWEAFRNDADWQHLKTETDANGPLAVSIDRYFMDRVDLSQLKTGVSLKP